MTKLINLDYAEEEKIKKEQRNTENENKAYIKHLENQIVSLKWDITFNQLLKTSII